jgi:hypothetical protein
MTGNLDIDFDGIEDLKDHPLAQHYMQFNYEVICNIFYLKEATDEMWEEMINGSEDMQPGE